jgi:hypothetical protein
VHPRRGRQGRFALRGSNIGDSEYPDAQRRDEGSKRETFHLNLRVKVLVYL